jgi:hypothetical protein
MDIADTRVDKTFIGRVMDDALCQFCTRVAKAIGGNEFVVLNAETSSLNESKAFADVPLPSSNTALTVTAPVDNGVVSLDALSENIEYAHNLLNSLVHSRTPEAESLEIYAAAIRDVMGSVDIMDQNGDVHALPMSTLMSREGTVRQPGFAAAARALCDMLVADNIPFRLV